MIKMSRIPQDLDYIPRYLNLLNSKILSLNLPKILIFFSNFRNVRIAS